ncbi:MAG: NAD(P)H-flavin reductase, partial [Pseudoalteromonas sp.]|nr:NAD(P)H-flavin reductase [Pseudoalteromonas sp.]
MQVLNAEVVSITPLTEFVYKVELKPSEPAEFK